MCSLNSINTRSMYIEYKLNTLWRYGGCVTNFYCHSNNDKRRDKKLYE